MKRFIFTIVYFIVILNYVSRAEDYCGLVKQQKLVCQSGDVAVSLRCPAGHKLDDIRASAFRHLSATDCTTVMDGSACEYNERSPSLTQQLQICSRSESCSNVRLSEPPGTDQCRDRGFEGSLFYVVSYVCTPDFNASTAEIKPEFISMDDSKTVSGEVVHLYSTHGAPMGNFIKDLKTGCTIELPAGANLVIDSKIFEKRTEENTCDQRVEVDANDGYATKFCKKYDTLTMSCFEKNRKIRMNYIPNDKTDSILFEFKLRVPSQYRMEVTCGIPTPDDLIPSQTTIKTVAGPFTVEELSLRGLITILCISIGIVFLVILLSAALIRRQRSVKRYDVQYSASEYLSSEPAFIIQSDKKTLVEDNPNTQYSGVF